MLIKQDIAAGIVFALAGVAGLVLGREYEVGVARAMGPGYLPTVLSWGLIVLGLAIAAKGAIKHGEVLAPWHMRPLLFVLAAVGIFALTIERAGLFLAVAATALLSSFANVDRRKGEVVALALVLAVTASALFVYGLSLPISILPPR
jgi:hypothetical protein